MFVPTVNGWHFANSFPAAPVFLGFGDSGEGLCGGMVFSSLARFRKGLEIPAAHETPTPGSAIFRELCRWQVASVFRGVPGFLSVRRHTDPFAWFVDKQLPRLREALERGPTPIVLLWTLALNPWKMVVNHQVLAYAADESRVRIYDPNYPDDDAVAIVIDREKEELRHCYWPDDPLVGISES
jgi:hypothetical protein